MYTLPAHESGQYFRVASNLSFSRVVCHICYLGLVTLIQINAKRQSKLNTAIYGLNSSWSCILLERYHTQKNICSWIVFICYWGNLVGGRERKNEIKSQILLSLWESVRSLWYHSAKSISSSSDLGRARILTFASTRA